ncbi:MAG TPA: hypothetical protein ENJ95_18705 [Bacteroidetes bacterium]|nr:hypothetical protein [Bacteroidota bacterium]
MYKTTFLIIACLFGISLYGQKLTWMPEQPAFKKSTEFYIVKWDGDELLVNASKSLHVLDKQDLKAKQSIVRKDLTTQKGERFMGVLKTENGWAALTSTCRMMQKKNSDCKIRYAMLGKDGFGAAKDWLVFQRKKATSVTLTGSNIEVSANGKYLMTWSYGKFTVYDASFEEVYAKEAPDIFTIDGQHVFMRVSKRAIDDDGNIYMAGIMMNEKMKRSDPKKYHPFFLRYDRAGDQFSQHIIDIETGVVLYPAGKTNYALVKSGASLEGRDDAIVAFDAANGRCAVAGLYGDKKGGGVFSVQYDFKNDEVVSLQKHPFPSDLSQRISKDSYKGKDIKGSVLLQDVLPKANGDVMVLLELDNSSVPAQLGATPRGSKIQCLDIIYLNIGPDNGLKYYGNIPKRQEEGEMEELSFVPVCVGNDVHVIYNSLTKKSGHYLVDATINETGLVEQKNLMGMKKGATTIFPNKLSWSIAFAFEGVVDRIHGYRKPVQVSENAVLVRAMKDRKNTLLKISY